MVPATLGTGDTATGAPDVNAIPTALIQRVEIVTGGASAVYGSDALAGVVNFILDKEFTGIKGTRAVWPRPLTATITASCTRWRSVRRSPITAATCWSAPNGPAPTKSAATIVRGTMLAYQLISQSG